MLLCLSLCFISTLYIWSHINMGICWKIDYHIPNVPINKSKISKKKTNGKFRYKSIKMFATFFSINFYAPLFTGNRNRQWNNRKAHRKAQTFQWKLPTARMRNNWKCLYSIYFHPWFSIEISAIGRVFVC